MVVHDNLDDGAQDAKSLEPDLTRKKKHLYFAECVCVRV